MKSAEIAQTVVNYLAGNYENLYGAMPNESYFLIEGQTRDERSRENSRIVRGTAVDVLADIIEKEQFFGLYVPGKVAQADNPNNAKLVLINSGDRIKGSFEVKYSNNVLSIAAQRVDPKGYLDMLRTAEGFKQSAMLLGVEGDLEKITSAIYT